MKICIRMFLIIICVALLAPFIANDKPLVCKYQDNWLFPAFSLKNNITVNNKNINYNMGNDWKLWETDFSVFAPCAYSPNTIDAANAPRKSPFDSQEFILKTNTTIPIPLKFRHWLGTTQNGNDVLSCIIHGTKTALSVGIFSMMIASFIGIILGAFSGYFENHGLKIGYTQLVFLLFGLFFSYFYCFIIRGDKLAEAFNDGGIWLILRLLFLLYVMFKTIGGLLWIGNWFDKKIGTDKKIYFPFDAIVLRMVEVLNSIPTLLLIIAVSAITKPSHTLLILIIGFLSWTNIARLTRAEFLKAKHLDYVTACKAIGMSNYKIISKQILPNVMPLILVQIIFGMAGAVLIEASLSFIGVGVPLTTITWGSLLNEARDHFSAWWLVVFPGLCIFTLILIYNKIATEITKNNNYNS